MALSLLKQQHKLASQTGVARRYFEAVPINEYWSLISISKEINRMYGTAVDAPSLQGTLKSLVESGLIRENRDGWSRVPVRMSPQKTSLADGLKAVRESRQVIKPGVCLPPVTTGPAPRVEGKEADRQNETVYSTMVAEISDLSTPATPSPAPASFSEATKMTTSSAATSTTNATANKKTTSRSLLEDLASSLRSMADDVDVVIDMMDEEVADLRSRLAISEKQIEATRMLREALGAFNAAGALGS